MTRVPAFPPMMKGLAAGPANPFTIACDQAARGVDAGMISWSLSGDRLRAALVLAPEVPLVRAMAGMVACEVGFQNAFGVLAPSETALQFEWTGGIRLNGGHVGGFRARTDARDPGAVPGWLVVGFELTLSLSPEWEPGETPDWTALDQEGCGDLDPLDLLEAWARHSLFWINALDEPDGRMRLHREWSALAWKLGEDAALPVGGGQVGGRYLGIDEDFGILLKTGTGTRLLPLTALLEEP